ncbi:L-lactate dehydrogenase (cytochrome)/(S)-mandelate dehydrogenase [Rhodoligotrophos appendicifer]|uniref:alpha-hydroxy acid oxidase n=1 Tax=Rhodoligotrophos appendicifer TaxID=987056 RepID=UPI001185083D|nr:alpha-hydroxy acid oxidase [Rhodoligotrophos appendicifer]
MTVQDAVSIADLHRLAKRRLPKIVFDYIEGGVEDELCLARNENAFQRYAFVPRYLIDVANCNQGKEIFGRRYSTSFGIAPTGMVGLFRPGGDLMLAKAAVQEDVPFILSGASHTSIEEAARAAPDHLWYQLYAARDRRIAGDLIDRAKIAGVKTLVVTVDVPCHPKRERNLRNGFSYALRPRPLLMLEALLHPGWMMNYYRTGGFSAFGDWLPYAGADATPAQSIDTFNAQFPCPSHTWDEIAFYRSMWPGALVVKGIMHPDDARRAVGQGADGIIVSNHGGRQLDRAASPVEVFPSIKAAVGEQTVLMLDSGIRRGADIIIAMCLGAQFVFAGRAMVYGVAAGGLVGVRRAIELLRREIDITLTQIGCADVAMLTEEQLLARGDCRTG